MPSGEVLPAAYCLLPRKDEVTYKKMWTVIKEVTIKINVTVTMPIILKVSVTISTFVPYLYLYLYLYVYRNYKANWE